MQYGSFKEPGTFSINGSRPMERIKPSVAPYGACHLSPTFPYVLGYPQYGSLKLLMNLFDQ
jgi:hypothetical protein